MQVLSVGELAPELVIQHGANQCLSACIYSLISSDLISERSTQEEITQHLESVGLATELGAGFHVSQDLNIVLKRYDLQSTDCFGIWGLDDQDPNKIGYRLLEIIKALQDDKQVIVALTRDRGNSSAPFTHFVVVSGYERNNDQEVFTIMDPSEIDGGIRKLTTRQVLKYLTPKAGLPVAGWAIGYGSSTTGQSDSNVALSMQAQFNSRQQLPGMELLDAPLFAESKLGFPIPSGTDHPISVAMPTSASVDQWSQYGDSVLSVDGKRPYGYPRFVIDPWVRELAVQVMGAIDWLPFVSRQDAKAASYLASTYANDKLSIVEKGGLFWLRETGGDGLNRDAWQFCGLGISSRQARAVVEGRGTNDLDARSVAQEIIKGEISIHTHARHEDIYLFPTGMAAIYVVNEVLKEIKQDAACVQFGFPYTDTFAVARRFGPNKNATQNIIDIRDCDIDKLQSAMSKPEKVRAVFTELPSNPKLYVPPLDQLATNVDGNVPIVIDDTVGTMFNIDSAKLPDAIDVRATSLTKFFSSVGDVMGGSLVLNPNSPFYEQIKVKLENRYADNTWFEDSQVMAKNSSHFREFMPVINSNGNELATWLNDEFSKNGGPIENVYYPSLTDQQGYDRFKSAKGGYGGLLSIDFVDPQVAYRFYDAVEISKGPGLGTYYSLACLYTKLAHKNELSTVEKFGVKEHLIRISTGIEPLDVLQERFTKAIEIAKH